MRYVLLLLFCCLLAVQGSYAQSQICTGSLGDPIVNIDFGSGSGAIGPALGTDALGKPLTTYPYSAGYPSDGQYTITNNTQSLNHATWWNTTDHTKNTGGYMMVVNASNSPGVFYTQTVNSLCPGTTYEFSAWVMNLATAPVSSKPSITFQITNSAGVILQSYNTQNIPESSSATWTQYAMQFTTPPGQGTITLTMINNGPGGNGNDIALDDITFRPCGPVITTNFAITSNSSASGCAGTAQSFSMSAQIAAGGYALPMYQWQVNNNGTWTDIPGANSTTYTANFTAATAVAGTYQYRMASANGNNISSPTCRVVSNVLTLTISPLPAINVLRPVVTVCEGEKFSQTLTNADPNSTYTWTKQGGGFAPMSPNLLINSTQLSDAGTYTITVVNAAGCTLTENVQLVVNPKVTATVSNASPSICEGDNVQLSASGGSTYLWSPATGLSNPNIANPVASPASTTTYTVTVSNSTCSATAQVTVNVTNKPVVNAGDDQKMTEGQTITLNGSVDNPAASYYWTPSTGLSDPNSLHPTAQPTEDITYTLHARTGAPCNFEVTDDVFIRVYKKVVVPNTFTPNGDGVNDNWNITALETYPESYTQVFNRLGRVVYQSRGYTKPWDGKLNGSYLPEGTYYYKIDLKPGTVLAGWVAIVR